MSKETCSTCNEETSITEDGDIVCTNIDCDDCAKPDLIPSCCLHDTRDDGTGIIRCSECGSPVEDNRLEEGEIGAFHSLNDYFDGAEDAEPPEPMELSEAWAVIRDTMKRFGIKLPEKEESDE